MLVNPSAKSLRNKSGKVQMMNGTTETALSSYDSSVFFSSFTQKQNGSKKLTKNRKEY